MRYIFLILLSIFLVSCSDSPETIQVVKDTKEIHSIIDERLLGSVEAINSTIALVIAMFTLIIAVIGFGFYDNSHKKKELLSEVEDKTTLMIDKKFKEQIEETNIEINKKTNSIINHAILRLKHESRKEEFLRNMLFSDLNKMHATEQKKNATKALNDYSDRYYIVSQLTSGISKEQTSALSRLPTGAYKKITKLESFKNYITFLKNSDISLDTFEKIEELEDKLIL